MFEVSKKIIANIFCLDENEELKAVMDWNRDGEVTQGEVRRYFRFYSNEVFSNQTSSFRIYRILIKELKSEASEKLKKDLQEKNEFKLDPKQNPPLDA